MVISCNRLLRIGLLASVLAISIVLLYFEYSFFTEHYSQDLSPVFKSGGTVGGDFISFYTAGKLFTASPSDIYAFDKQKALQDDFLAGNGNKFAPFFYPPPIAGLLSTISGLSFHSAFLAFSISSFVLGALAISSLVYNSKLSHLFQITLILQGIAFVPFAVDTIAGGQIATIGILIAIGFYLAASRNHKFLAGLILSCGFYKPPLFLFFALTILVIKDWRILQGALIGGVLWIALSISMVGLKTFSAYCNIALSYRAGAEVLPQISVDPDQGVGLYSFLIRYLPSAHGESFFIHALIITLVLALLVRARSKYNGENFIISNFPVLFSLSLFLSIQIVRYDLAIFIVPGLLAAARAIREHRILPSILILGTSLWIDIERVIHGARGESIVLATFSLVIVIAYERFTQLGTPYTAQDKTAS